MKAIISLLPSSLIHSHTIYKLAKHVIAEKVGFHSENHQSGVCATHTRIDFYSFRGIREAVPLLLPLGKLHSICPSNITHDFTSMSSLFSYVQIYPAPTFLASGCEAKLDLNRSSGNELYWKNIYDPSI
jgi:hypothetical protein